MQWQFQVLVAVSILVIARLLWLFVPYWKDQIFFSRSLTPSVETIRSKGSISRRNEYFDWLIDSLKRGAQTGTLQEEPIISALEDRLVHDKSLLREVPALCILFALLITFYMLFSKLPHMFDNQVPDLRPIIALVGANFWLIGAGFLFSVGSLFERRINLCRFEIYRQWLEREIFPFLGVARTTGDRLAAALETFSSTVKKIEEAIYPISGLASVMQGFQENLIAEMIPALTKGMKKVQIGLSDAAIGELQKTTVESTRALREMKDQQAKMLSLITSGERRSAELASYVSAIATQTGVVAKVLQDQSTILTTNNLSLAQVHASVEESTKSNVLLTSSLARLDKSTVSHIQVLENLAQDLSGLSALVRGTDDDLKELHKSSMGVQAGLSDLVTSEGSLRSEVEQSRGVITHASKALTAALADVSDLKDRWSEAMLQMASLIEDISKQTGTFEKSATTLTEVGGLIAMRLPQIEDGLTGVAAKIDALNGSTAAVANGNKDIVSAFADLQIAGQKLRNIGNSIVGHFDVWQTQTSKVYSNAEESTKGIEASFKRIGEVINGFERMLRDLSERQTVPELLPQTRGSQANFNRPSFSEQGAIATNLDELTAVSQQSSDMEQFEGELT